MGLLASALGFEEPWLHHSADEVIDEVLAATAETLAAAARHHPGTAEIRGSDADPSGESDALRRRPIPDAQRQGRTVLRRRWPTRASTHCPAGSATQEDDGGVATGEAGFPSDEALYLLTPASHHFVSSSLASQPGLLQNAGPPFVEIHPDDAARRGIDDDDTVLVDNGRGSCLLRAVVTDAVRAGRRWFSPKGRWAKLHGGTNVNWTTSDALADMAGQSTFHSNRVWVRAPSNRSDHVTLEQIPSWVREYTMRLVGAVLILLVGWIATRLLVGPLRRLLARSGLDVSVSSFLVNTVRTLILIAVLLAVLQQFGLETTSLLTLLGTVGLAVALSLQGSLANFASGLLLLAFRTVRVGDWIEVGDARGRVSEMLPFHIVLETLDNQRITVPNTALTNGAVRNNTYLPSRRVQWTLPVSAGDDLDAVKAALRNRLQAEARILKEPPPQIHVQDWTADRRTLAVTGWTATADYVDVQQEMLEELGKSLESVQGSH